MKQLPDFLARGHDPADPSRWRAWTGTGFTAAFPDPYRVARPNTATCRPVGPFPGPVGTGLAVLRRNGRDCLGFRRGNLGASPVPPQGVSASDHHRGSPAGAAGQAQR